MSGCFATVLAHQGGWDEALLVGVPILAIVGVLAIAKRRVDAQARAGHGPAAGPPRTGDRSAG
jgi:hypothetical protein